MKLAVGALTIALVMTACGADKAEDRAADLVDEMATIADVQAQPWQGSSSTDRSVSIPGCSDAHPDQDDQWISKSGTALVQQGETPFTAEGAARIADHFETQGWQVRRGQDDQATLPVVIDAVLNDDTIRVFATSTRYTLSAESGPCAPFNVRDLGDRFVETDRFAS